MNAEFSAAASLPIFMQFLSSSFTGFILCSSFRRDGGRSSYRITIPWEVVAPGFSPAAGATGIRWNLAVSDNDGDDTVSLPKLKGYEKSLQLFPGLVDRKAPAEWGELILP